MHVRHRLMFFLKWFGISWTACAVGVVILSNVMIVTKWPSIMGVLPYDVKDGLRVAFLLAPGAVAAIVHWVLEKRQSNKETKGKNPQNIPSTSHSGRATNKS